MHYLTLGTCWKEEDDYAEDFIKYHKSVGVEHFVIYDREFHKINEMFKDDPMVEVIHFPDTPQNVHAVAWGNLIDYNKGKTKWLCLIDADQCLVPVKTNDVKEILKDYEQFASLSVNWSTLGSSGKIEKDNGSLYERFTKRAKLDEGINDHCQFFCQPDRTLSKRTDDPHHPKLPSGEISVNTNKQQVNGPFNKPPLHDLLYINHYITKSKNEWSIKNAKGRGDIFGQKMPFDLFNSHDSICNAEDDFRALDLWNKIKV